MKGQSERGQKLSLVGYFLLSGVLVTAAAAEISWPSRPRTLAQALTTLGEEQGLQYVAALGPQRRQKVSLRAATLEEAVTTLLAQFGARGVKLDEIWLIDARAPALPFQDYLRTFVPPSVLPWLEEADSKRVQEGLPKPAEELARTLYRRLTEGLPPPGPDEYVVVPCTVSAGKPSWSGLRDWLLSREMRPLFAEDFLAPYPWEGKEQLVYRNGELRLYSSPSKGFLLLQARLPSCEVPEKLPRWFQWQYYAPRFLRNRWAVVLPQRVIVQGQGSLAAFLTQISAQVTARCEARKAVATLPLAVALRDVPLWLALQALSVASGVPFGPLEDAEVYTFRAPQNLWEEVFARTTPERRLPGLYWPRGLARNMLAGVWPLLTTEQRQKLLEGEVVRLAALSPEAQRWVRLCLHDQEWRRNYYQAARAEVALRQAQTRQPYRCLFIAAAEGYLRLVISFGSGNFRQGLDTYWKPLPKGVEEPFFIYSWLPGAGPDRFSSDLRREHRSRWEPPGRVPHNARHWFLVATPTGRPAEEPKTEPEGG